MKCRRYVRGTLDPALLLIGADIFTVHGSVARCEPWPDLHICTTMHKSSPGCPNLFMSAFWCTDRSRRLSALKEVCGSTISAATITTGWGRWRKCALRHSINKKKTRLFKPSPWKSLTNEWQMKRPVICVSLAADWKGSTLINKYKSCAQSRQKRR